MSETTQYRLSVWQKIIGAIVTIMVAYIGYMQVLKPTEIQSKQDFDLQLYTRLNEQIDKLTLRVEMLEERDVENRKTILILQNENTTLRKELAQI